MRNRLSFVFIATFCLLLLQAGPAAAARNFPLQGDNELSGGIGFAADLSDFTPGGFRWFNEYAVLIGGITWLDFQLNLTVGDHRSDYCVMTKKGLVCNRRGFDGTGLELGVGAKFKWRLQRVPLQFHAKVGGAVDFIWFGGDFLGVGIPFRGGGGARYFVLPTLGVGAELMFAVGPSFIDDWGVEVYGTIEMNFGVEWRFSL